MFGKGTGKDESDDIKKNCRYDTRNNIIRLYLM